MLRTALTLSAVYGKSFRMENIRGSRNNSGLKRQHMEAVKAVARLSNAEVEGLKQGSQQITFRPGELKPQNFTVNIGTAGSVNLILDTVMPLASQFNEEFRLDVKGGTDVKWSPSGSYEKQVKLPLLREKGFTGELEYPRTGFYPEGSGRARLTTELFSLQPLELTRRGELELFEIYSTASKDLEGREVADRQAKELEKHLKSLDPSAEVEKNIEYVGSDSTGSVLVLKAEFSESVAGFDIYGEKGVKSEELAKELYEDFQDFWNSKGAIDSLLGDQLMVYMAIAGGRISVPELTPHMRTNLETIRKFGVEMGFIEREKDVLIET
jgi:RNA 3'-terminal phosphate cyclase (ATP)